MSYKGLQRQIKFLECVRGLHPWIGIQTVYALLYIIEKTHYASSSVRVMDVGIILGTSSASATRNIAWLVKHDLIEIYENPEKRNEKYIKLTKQGKRLVKKLEVIE